MRPSSFSFKNKRNFVSFVVLTSCLAFLATGGKATEMPAVKHKVSGDYVSPQNELMLMVHKLDDHSYIVFFEKIKNCTKQQDEKSAGSLKTSRKAVKESLIKENIKHLSRYKAEFQD